MENKISALSTTCKECLFAKYDGSTQVGCELGRIEKVKTHPVYQLVEAMDDEKEFYVINYHLCLYQRIKGWPHDYKPMEEMISEVKDEIKMRWGAILILRSEDRNNMSRVEKRLNEIFSQKNPPSWVGIVNDDKDLDVYWIIDYLNKKEVVWHIQSSEEGQDRDAIDIILDKTKHRGFSFYAVFDSDKEISVDFYKTIHENVIDGMLQYSVIKDEDTLHNMVVNKVAHFKFGGNAGSTLEQNVKNGSEHTLLVEYKNLL